MVLQFCSSGMAPLGGAAGVRYFASRSSRCCAMARSPLLRRTSETGARTASSASRLTFPTPHCPEYLYSPFMGHSTRFATMDPPLSCADVTQLEREPLTHSTPGRVNDHVCIAMVKTLRWLADRLFRERHIHRATMLLPLMSAAPAAGSVAAYLRMLFKKNRHADINKIGEQDGVRRGSAKGAVAAEASSPFLSFHPSVGMKAGKAQPCGPQRRRTAARPSLHTPSTNWRFDDSSAPLQHSYVSELRGLLAQCECHAVHHQIVGAMADISPWERGLVLLLQAVHFLIYLVLFLCYPRMGFRLMAYTAEESSVVWTQMVNDIDMGKIAEPQVPQLALRYWGLRGSFTAQGPLLPGLRGVMALRESPRDVSDTARPCTSSGAAVISMSDPNVPSQNASGGQLREGEEEGTSDASIATKELETKALAARTLDASTRPFSSVADKALDVLTLREVILLIRADEMVYRDLNHEIASELDTQRGWLQRIVDTFSEK